MKLWKKEPVIPDSIQKKIIFFLAIFLPNKTPIKIKTKRQLFQAYFEIKVLCISKHAILVNYAYTFTFSSLETIHHAMNAHFNTHRLHENLKI